LGIGDPELDLPLLAKARNHHIGSNHLYQAAIQNPIMQKIESIQGHVKSIAGQFIV
jgi:hypothetical protein